MPLLLYNITLYYTHHCRDWDRIYMRVWTHKVHPIPRPKRWAMGCLLWWFWNKNDCIIMALHCMYFATVLQQPWITFAVCCVVVCFSTSWFHTYPLESLQCYWTNLTSDPERVKELWGIWVNKSHETSFRNSSYHYNQQEQQSFTWFMGYTLYQHTSAPGVT